MQVTCDVTIVIPLLNYTRGLAPPRDRFRLEWGPNYLIGGGVWGWRSAPPLCHAARGRLRRPSAAAARGTAVRVRDDRAAVGRAPEWESRECHVPGWTCKYSSDAERRLCLTLARSVGHLLTGETVVQVRMLVASVCEL